MNLKKYNELDKEVQADRDKRFGNEYHNIDDLPLTELQKKCVLEWLAQKLWVIQEESTDGDYYCKSYDPLKIDGNIAHSYVFDMEDGGRHHSFKNLVHLEKMLVRETIENLKGWITDDTSTLP